jgi:hypothetical protein
LIWIRAGAGAVRSSRRPGVDGGHDPRQSGEDRAPPPDRFTADVAAFLRLILGLA